MFKYTEKLAKGLFSTVSHRLCSEWKNNANWHNDKSSYFNWCIEARSCWEVVLQCVCIANGGTIWVIMRVTPDPYCVRWIWHYTLFDQIQYFARLTVCFVKPDFFGAMSYYNKHTIWIRLLNPCSILSIRMISFDNSYQYMKLRSPCIHCHKCNSMIPQYCYSVHLHDSRED